MIYEVQRGRACDSLARQQNGVIERAMLYINTQDSLLNIRAEQLDNFEKKEDIWRGLYENQVEQKKVVDAERKRWKLTTFIGGALIVLITIL